MNCRRCAHLGICLCREIPELVDAPAPWPDDDPEAETYYADVEAS